MGGDSQASIALSVIDEGEAKISYVISEHVDRQFTDTNTKPWIGKVAGRGTRTSRAPRPELSCINTPWICSVCCCKIHDGYKRCLQDIQLAGGLEVLS